MREKERRVGGVESRALASTTDGHAAVVPAEHARCYPGSDAFAAHTLQMPGSRRLSSGAGVTAVALLLAVTLAAGCGSSGTSASAPARGSSVAADPPKAPPVAEGASPGAPRALSAPGSSTAVTPTGQTTRRPIPPAHPVPAAFRPAPGAPSDAEVRSELAQLDAIQRQAHQRALSAAAGSLAELLPWSMESKSGVQVSVASVFRDYGLGLACGGVLGRDQLGVAHKTAPCGTLITFTYGRRSLTVPVIDRGPYVAGRGWGLNGAAGGARALSGAGPVKREPARALGRRGGDRRSESASASSAHSGRRGGRRSHASRQRCWPRPPDGRGSLRVLCTARSRLEPTQNLANSVFFRSKC